MSQSDLTVEVDRYLKRLFPVTRSLTGPGNRETLGILKELIDLKVIEVPCGTKVFDWTIPPEWHPKEAYIEDLQGNRLVDFQTNNVHLLGYSEGVDAEISYDELAKHVHTMKDQPDWIPYRTSYYQKTWGFCLSENQWRKDFKPGEKYKVKIDTEFVDGSMSLGEFVLPGKTGQEFLVSTYICHPSLANDNMSGFVLAAFLARELAKLSLNYTYRFVFVPETIGVIAYLWHRREEMKKIDAGIVTTTVAGPGKFGYKQSFQRDHILHHMLEGLFEESGEELISYPFDIHGSDERQYSSPGFRIPTISLCKDKYYEYPQYHTSADNLDFISAQSLCKTFEYTKRLLLRYDSNLVYQRHEPHGEIMLSKHDLYPKIGGAIRPGENISDLDLILWLLWYFDGKKDLFSIASELNVPMERLFPVVDQLLKKKVIQSC